MLYSVFKIRVMKHLEWCWEHNKDSVSINWYYHRISIIVFWIFKMKNTTQLSRAKHELEKTKENLLNSNLVYSRAIKRAGARVWWKYGFAIFNPCNFINCFMFRIAHKFIFFIRLFKGLNEIMQGEPHGILEHWSTGQPRAIIIINHFRGNCIPT